MSRSIDMHALAASPPTLRGGVTMHVDPLDPARAVVRLIADKDAISLRAMWLTVPYPSGLRRLVRLDPSVDLVLVEQARSSLVEAAAEAGVAVLDRRGYGRVVQPGFVYVAPAPPGHSPTATATRSPFAPKASRVVRQLLVAPQTRWRLSSLAEQARLNPGNVHRILASLLETGMVERDEDEYVVTDPGSLLEAWAETQRWPREQVRLPVSGSLRATISDLMEVLESTVVVSGEFAAEALAPYLPARKALLHCIDRAAWNRLGEDAYPNRHIPPHRIADGQLVVVLSDEGVADHAEFVDGLPIAHPVQIYVDLFGDRGRGREAGEQLRMTHLGY